jgi:hypothetical protein
VSKVTKIIAEKSGAKKNNKVSPSRKKRKFNPVDSPATQISHLQHTIGNQTVQRLFKSGTLQAKLKIGKPGDKYELEADRVADQVMSMTEMTDCLECKENGKEPVQTKPITTQITPLVRRQVEPEEEEEKPIQTKPISEQITPLVQRQTEEEKEEEPIQPKLLSADNAVLQRQTESKSSSATEATAGIESSINSLKGGGQPLPESTRNYFEPRFGSSFAQVRVHNNSQAANIARTVNAKAFTKGKDIVFSAGQYSPETSGGKRLIAHELTHVVQQRGVLRPKLAVGQPGDRYNQEEDRVARAVKQQEEEEPVKADELRGRSPYTREQLGVFLRTHVSTWLELSHPVRGGIEAYGFDVYSKKDGDMPVGQLVKWLNETEERLTYHLLKPRDAIAMQRLHPGLTDRLYAPGRFYKLRDMQTGIYLDIGNYCANHAFLLHLAKRRKHAEEEIQSIETELAPSFGNYWDSVKEVLRYKLPMNESLCGWNFQVKVSDTSPEILMSWRNAITAVPLLDVVVPFTLLKAKSEFGFLVFNNRNSKTMKIDLVDQTVVLKFGDLHLSAWDSVEWRSKVGDCFLGIKRQILNPVYTGVTWKVGCKKTDTPRKTKGTHRQQVYLQYIVEGDLNASGRLLLIGAYVLTLRTIAKAIGCAAKVVDIPPIKQYTLLLTK